MRQLKREVKIGNVTIGGKNPIAVQTMLNVPVEDIEGNVAQAKRCEAAGCQILRVTCPSAADAKCIEAVKNAVNIPIVADIHFDYKAALACADVGVDKIRINPGNIGDDDRVKAVVQACQQKNIPIRIGVNGGSLEKHILAKYGAPVPEAMVESALYHVRLLEKFDFNNIVISIKNSNVPRMMEAYRQLSAVTDYPLHVGVTEAGTYQMGLLKSGMGIGGMLLEGIGDTIRVSLAAEPEKRWKQATTSCVPSASRWRARRSSPAPPAAAPSTPAPRSPTRWKSVCRAIRNPSRWPLWAVSSTAPVRPARPTSALPAARARQCCLSTASPSRS